MTHYLLSIMQPDGDPPPAEELDAIMAEMTALDAALHDADVWVYNGGLHPPDQSVVVRDGDVSAGPFLAGDVQVGGFWIIDVPDLATAQEWATRAARASTLPIEIRAIQR